MPRSFWVNPSPQPKDQRFPGLITQRWAPQSTSRTSDDTGWVPCPRTNNLLRKTSKSSKKVIDDSLCREKGVRIRSWNVHLFDFAFFFWVEVVESHFLGCFPPKKRPIVEFQLKHISTDAIPTESRVGSENQRRIDATNRSRIWKKSSVSNTHLREGKKTIRLH